MLPHTAFLPPALPLPPRAPVRPRAARPRAPRPARPTHPRAADRPPSASPASASASSPAPASASAPSPSPAAPAALAPCVPAEAREIGDASAQAMLQRLQYSPIATPLPHGTVHTSHVRSPPGGPGPVDPTAPALVCLPGFDSNLLEYRFMLPLLDALPYDVHIVDPLGVGLTETRVARAGEGAGEGEELHFGPAEKRAHLAAFIRSEVAAAERPVVLVGASLGGATALHYHLTENENEHEGENGGRAIAALVLIDAQAFTDRRVGANGPSERVARAGARVLRAGWLRRVAMWLSYESRALRGDDDVFRIGRLHCGRDGWMESMVDFIRRDAYCLSGRVCDTSVPTLVLWGDNDRVMPKGDAERFGAAVRDCEVQYVSRAGHSPHIEQAEAVTRAIDAFLRKQTW